jgi:hypothetical protein
MLTARRWSTVAVSIGLGIYIGLVGCRREEPTEPKKPTVPKIPAVTPVQKPAPAPSAKPKPLRPPAAAPRPTAVTKPAARPTTAPEPASVDEQDAPDAPPFFPRSRTAMDWVKHDPVRTALAGELAKLVPAKIIAVVKPYQIKKVATCTYQRGVRIAKQEARILLIETHQVDDAYGLFSVLGTGKLTKGTGMLTRTDTAANRQIMHVWKGHYYLRLTGPGSGHRDGVEACQALVRKITFAMPDASPPELIAAFPQAGRLAGQQWLIREWPSLSGAGVAAIKLPEPKQLGQALGLNKDSLMVITAYRIEGAARPNLVWVVRYDTPAQAREAYTRYQAALARATDVWAASTMLVRPKGQYVFGTWTAEEESLLPVLPKLQSVLE